MSIRSFVVCLYFILNFASVLEGVIVVNSEFELQNAIFSINSGADTLIQFGSSFTYSRELQPLNTDNVLNSVDNTFTINGQGNTLIQETVFSSFRGFFARQSTGSVTIQNLTIDGSQAIGGDGGPHAGGGLGAGGGLFLNSGSTVILDNVSFKNCQASGGAGDVSGTFGGGGGGFGGSGGLSGGLGGGGRWRL